MRQKMGIRQFKMFCRRLVGGAKSTTGAINDSSPDIISESDYNNNTIGSSESQLPQNYGSTLQDVDPALLVTSDPSSRLRPESLSEFSIVVDPIEGRSSSDVPCSSDTFSGSEGRESLALARGYKVISAFTETGQAESSIKVLKQRAYTATELVILSSLADTPCAVLGVRGVLDRLNATFGTSYSLDNPSLSSLLQDCIMNDSEYDFGTAYSYLRRAWCTSDWSAVRNRLYTGGAEDQEMRQKAFVGNEIVKPDIPPRRVWDLYSNRVVPWWIASEWPWPISHAWVDEGDRVKVWTPINGCEWPVPIPKDANLNLIRIEMLNLGARYVWIDVLCLRQEGGPREDLRIEEWKLDVPTIGSVYRNTVVCYLSGLGRPLSLEAGDFKHSDRSWFRRAWTLQEAGKKRIIAGDIPGGLLRATPMDEEGNSEELPMSLQKQMGLVWRISQGGIFNVLAEMQKRKSTNKVDKVAGLSYLLRSTTIPPYSESQPLEHAWTALTNTMSLWNRANLFFVFPEPGEGCKKWRPTWGQLMTNSKPLPVDIHCGSRVDRDKDADDDWYDGPCIEKGTVQGLAVGSGEGVHRCGELIVEDAHETAHTFKITATHQYQIPEDMYTLFGAQRNTRLWVIGRRMEKGFEKVSVMQMTDAEERRLKDLGVATKSRSVLA